MSKKDDHDLLIEATTNIKNIRVNVVEIKAKLDNDYVTKEEFEPVKKLVYGLVGIILLTVVGALLAVIIVQPNL